MTYEVNTLSRIYPISIDREVNPDSFEDLVRYLDEKLAPIVDELDERKNPLWKIMARSEILCASSNLGAAIIALHPHLHPQTLRATSHSYPGKGYELVFEGPVSYQDQLFCSREIIDAANRGLVTARTQEGCKIHYAFGDAHGKIEVIYDRVPQRPEPQRHLGLSPVA